MKTFFLNAKSAVLKKVGHKINPDKRSTALNSAWNSMDQSIMKALLRIELTELNPYTQYTQLDNCLTSNNFILYLKGSTKVLKVNVNNHPSSDEKKKLVEIFRIVQNANSESDSVKKESLGQLQLWFENKLPNINANQASLIGTVNGMTTPASPTMGSISVGPEPHIFNYGTSLFSPITSHVGTRVVELPIGSESGSLGVNADVGFSCPPPPGSSQYLPEQHKEAVAEEVVNSQTGSNDAGVDPLLRTAHVTRAEARHDSSSSSASSAGNSSQDQSKTRASKRRESRERIKPNIVKDTRGMFEEQRQTAAGN
jgi:hypothetical protein